MKYCPHCGNDISMYQAAEVGHLPVVTSSMTATLVPAAAPASFVYDQTKIWIDLVAQARVLTAPPVLMELVDNALERYRKRIALGVHQQLETNVHIVFDKPIVPNGGLLYQAMQADGKTSPSPASLTALGYLVVDGKVIEADGFPVSPAYGALNYWGGEKQFKRWHLTGPITINPSRNGNPFFMDEEMMAFGATWRDLEKMKEAMMNLMMAFAQGVTGDAKPIAQPMVLEITPR